MNALESDDEDDDNWHVGDGDRWPRVEVWERWRLSCLWFRWGRYNLAFWRLLRTWSLGWHRGGCCALNVMVGPVEFMLTHPGDQA